MRYCSSVSWLLDSAVEPFRTIIRFRGSPVLALFFSRPTASAFTMMYTATTMAMPRIVARVERQRTSTLLTLYLIGSGISLVQGFQPFHHAHARDRNGRRDRRDD